MLEQQLVYFRCTDQSSLVTASAPPLCGEIVGQFSPIRYRSISVSMIDEPLIGIGPGTGRTAGLGGQHV